MTSEVDDAFQLRGETLEGRFVVGPPVAEGGFGVVYRAEQVALERPVALKVLKTPPGFDEAANRQFLERFAAEAKTIARISHPNIVLVLDFGVSTMPSGERAAWMALEWLTGETLEADLLRRRGSGGRTPAECLDLLRPVLSAVAVVHAAGVAHRDLKPSNIMMVPGPGGATLKLLDFGIAKLMDADEAPGTGKTRTRSAQIAFSPGYASPEQISQGRSGPWTDVHALGLLLTEVLTDREPLEGDEAALLFQQIVDRERPTPAKFGVGVGAWEAVLGRALAVSPTERYRDAGELLAGLEATLGDATHVPAARTRGVVTASGRTLASGAADTVAVPSAGELPSASAMTPAVPPRLRVTTGSPISGDWALTPARGRLRPRVALIAAALALGGVVSVGWRLAARAPASPTAASSGAPLPASAATSPPAVPSTLPAVVTPAPSTLPSASSATTAPSAGASAPAVPPRSPTPASRPAPVPRPPPAQEPRPAPPNCDPPFTIDSSGFKHYKPACSN